MVFLGKLLTDLFSRTCFCNKEINPEEFCSIVGALGQSNNVKMEQIERKKTNAVFFCKFDTCIFTV